MSTSIQSAPWVVIQGVAINLNFVTKMYVAPGVTDPTKFFLIFRQPVNRQTGTASDGSAQSFQYDSEDQADAAFGKVQAHLRNVLAVAVDLDV